MRCGSTFDRTLFADTGSASGRECDDMPLLGDLHVRAASGSEQGDGSQEDGLGKRAFPSRAREQTLRQFSVFWVLWVYIGAEVRVY